MTSTKRDRGALTWKALSSAGPFLGLAIVIGLFGALEPESFLTWYNFKTVTIQTGVVALAAMGMTLIIISGGIDLSVGSVIALSSVVCALVVKAGHPIAALPAALAAGAICGVANGFMITGFRIVPFIATLGMMGIARGISKYLAHEQKIDAPLSWINHLMEKSGAGFLLPSGTWIMLVSTVLVALFLRYSMTGRYTIAIGSNENAADLSGVNVRMVKMVIYTAAGIFTGMAGVLQFARLSVGDPTVALGAELDVIAAVVIGGGSLSGGEGSVLGSLLGAFIMSFLRNGCSMTGVPNYFQDVLIGAIIIGAVAADQWRKKR